MNTVIWLRKGLARRPLWMNAILLFCVYMTFIYLPWDIFIKPLKVDQEVWFGVLFTGWAAAKLALCFIGLSTALARWACGARCAVGCSRG